jgi:hypothetical protein
MWISDVPFSIAYGVIDILYAVELYPSLVELQYHPLSSQKDILSSILKYNPAKGSFNLFIKSIALFSFRIQFFTQNSYNHCSSSLLGRWYPIGQI